jgi:hypothetical protein
MLKSGRGFAAFLLVFFAIITFSNFASAGEQLLFDRSLTIGDWHVHASQNSFSAADAQKARIKISKNTTDREIQRGIFVLNGAFTFLRDFLTGDELVFEKDVTLKTANTLFVFLLGEPGAEISFQIIVDEAPAPAPEISAFTAEPLSIKRGETATLTWQTDYADSCVIEPIVGAVDPNGSVSVTPIDTTTYTLTAEGAGDPATAAVTVTIENSAPVAELQTVSTDEDAAVAITPMAEPQAVSTDEDTAVAVTLTATDVDGDSLTYAVTVQPGNGTLSGAPPNLNYTPNSDYNGPDAFSFTASDGAATSGAASVDIAVKPINDAPVARAGQDREVFVGDLVTLDGSSSADVDADSLNFSWTFTSAENPTFTPDVAGSYEVQLIVNDGEFDSPPDQVVITVSPRMVEVPNVVGLLQENAEAALLADKLLVGDVTRLSASVQRLEHLWKKILLWI